MLRRLRNNRHLAGHFAATIQSYKRMNHVAPWTHVYIAAANAQMGQMVDARTEIAIFADMSKDGYAPGDYIEMEPPLYGAPSFKDRWLKGYCKAGVEV